MRLSFQLGIISAVNISFSFVYQWYLLAKLGPGVETDALFAGMSIPQLVLAVISASLMHVLVPLMSGKDEGDIHQDSWAFLAMITGMFTLLSLCLYLTAAWWVPLTVPGFSISGQELTIRLTRIQLLGMIFSAINGVQWATYHAKQQFLWAESAPIISSFLAIIILAWALPRYGIEAAAWINTSRMLLQTLLLGHGMGRPVLPDLRRQAIRLAWQRIQPLLLGTAFYKTDPLIDRFLLSSASSGSLSLYYLAQQIYGAATQLVNKAFAVPLVPALSTLHKAGDINGFWQLYRLKFTQILFTGALFLLVFLFLGKPMLGLLVGHGHISSNNVSLLWLLMVLMSGQFIIGNMGVVMTSMFFALGDTKSPTVSGSMAYTLGIPIRISMYYLFSLKGLAAAISIYYVISLFLMLLQVRKVRSSHAQTLV